jgi:hypothetical protein
MQVIRHFFLILCLVTTGIFDSQHLEPMEQVIETDLDASTDGAVSAISTWSDTGAERLFQPA